MLLEQTRKKVIEIALKVQKEKLIALTFGNFSIRDRETGYVCVTPSGMNYEDLLPEDIVVVDVNCNIVDGARKPSIETPMHCAIYRKRNDVYGVVHTHSTFATAWSCCEINIPCVVAEVAALIGGEIECAPYKPMGSLELAETIAEAIGEKDAVLLAKHGALSVGPDIDTAFTNAVIVEEGAKVAFYARNIDMFTPIPKEECDSLRQYTLEKYGQKYCGCK